MRGRQRLRAADRTGTRRHRRALPAAAAAVLGRRAPQLAVGAPARAVDLLPVVPRRVREPAGRRRTVPGAAAGRAARLHALGGPLPRRLSCGVPVAIRRSAAPRRCAVARHRLGDRRARETVVADPPQVRCGARAGRSRSRRHARSRAGVHPAACQDSGTGKGGAGRDAAGPAPGFRGPARRPAAAAARRSRRGAAGAAAARCDRILGRAARPGAGLHRQADGHRARPARSRRVRRAAAARTGDRERPGPQRARGAGRVR